MDLGITGRRAILLGSSRGLGRACAESIAREGAQVVINGRTAADVDEAVTDLRAAYNVEVTGVVGDASVAEADFEKDLDANFHIDFITAGNGIAEAR